MKRVLVIDDVKEFTFPADTGVTYARTLRLAWPELLSRDSWNELWLDHDLGGDDTIRPLVLWLAEQAFSGHAYPVGLIVICSLNIVGVEWMESTLSPYYQVVICDKPQKLEELTGSFEAKWY
jgi:hypothetical protein